LLRLRVLVIFFRPFLIETDWKARYDVVQALSEFAKKNNSQLSRSKLLHKFFDVYTKLLQDSNIKVSSFAINSFHELSSTIKVRRNCVYLNNKAPIESNVASVSQAIFALISSSNSTVKVAADSLFHSLVKKIDYAVLWPCWTGLLPYANYKAKVMVLYKIIGKK
jgi:hypothetical protein